MPITILNSWIVQGRKASIEKLLNLNSKLDNFRVDEKKPIWRKNRPAIRTNEVLPTPASPRRTIFQGIREFGEPSRILAELPLLFILVVLAEHCVGSIKPGDAVTLGTLEVKEYNKILRVSPKSKLESIEKLHQTSYLRKFWVSNLAIEFIEFMLLLFTFKLKISFKIHIYAY